ncbi:MAG TPA: protein kinase, partial [Polyangium sp.]|nr:protein kinase [Polyangium sp.]
MSDDLVVGAIFAGRYRVERRIAAGGMGAVYEVMHLETSRRRALKVMHPDLCQNDESRDRFRQEASVTAQIESEYIVDVFDAGVDATTGMPYLVMELLQGEEISKRIKRLERLSSHDTVLYLHQAALALDKTHRSRIVHRDLKPDNLYLCEREDGPPRIKLLDFGIAKIVAANAASANATQAVGTPLYMAPEQFLAESAVSAATDLYALGMIAYTMLVGQTYWFEESKKGANVFAFAAYATMGPQEKASVRALRNGIVIPVGFDAWFSKATARKPTERFPTASAMVAALSEALGLPPPAAILANAFAQGHSASLIPPEPERLSHVQLVGTSTSSLHGSANTTSQKPIEPRKPMVIFGAIGAIACMVLLLLYVVFSSDSDATSPEQATDGVASAHSGPSVVPLASATVQPPETATAPASAPPESVKSTAPAVTRQSPAPSPAPRNTTAPTSTTKKKDKW